LIFLLWAVYDYLYSFFSYSPTMTVEPAPRTATSPSRGPSARATAGAGTFFVLVGSIRDGPGRRRARFRGRATVRPPPFRNWIWNSSAGAPGIKPGMGGGARAGPPPSAISGGPAPSHPPAGLDALNKSLQGEKRTNPGRGQAPAGCPGPVKDLQGTGGGGGGPPDGGEIKGGAEFGVIPGGARG